jgi:hypothetical protein
MRIGVPVAWRSAEHRLHGSHDLDWLGVVASFQPCAGCQEYKILLDLLVYFFVSVLLPPIFTRFFRFAFCILCFRSSVAKMIYLRLISLFTIFTSLALAQTSTRSGISALETGNVGDGCVDPREFASCFKQTEDAFVDCGVRCNITRPSPDCILQCGKTRDAGNFGCAIENCWNQVYSCEYQLMALNFILSNDLIHDQPIVPFYPPPPGAEGACCEYTLALCFC